MIAARLDVPVVPVRLEGLDRILHHSWKFPVRGSARVSFGAPLRLEGSDYPALARQSKSESGICESDRASGGEEASLHGDDFCLWLGLQEVVDMAQSLIGKGSN